MAVYLIHFETKLHHAGHYLGFAEDIAARLARHKAGRGAKLLQILRDKKINFEVVRIWAGADKKFERRLKISGHNNRLCPICNPSKFHLCGLENKGKK